MDWRRRRTRRCFGVSRVVSPSVSTSHRVIAERVLPTDQKTIMSSTWDNTKKRGSAIAAVYFSRTIARSMCQSWRVARFTRSIYARSRCPERTSSWTMLARCQLVTRASAIPWL